VHATLLTAGVLISHPQAVEPENGYTTASVTHGHATPDLRLSSQLHSNATVPEQVVISHPAEGKRLSFPKWLVTHEDSIHT